MAEERNYIGIAMDLDVTSLKAGLADANKQIQLANSEFKAASSGMDDWTKSTEGLTLKIDQLDNVLNLQKKKLNGLQAEYDQTVKSQGENSEAARKLKIQLNNQQATVNKTEKELNNYKGTLKDAKEGTIDLEKASLKGGKAIEKAGKDAANSSEGFTIAKGAIANLISNGLTALVGAAKNALSSLYNLSDETMEYREDIGKLQTAFSDAGHTTEEATATYKELYGVFGEEDRAVEAAQQIAKLAKSEEEMAKMTNIATGVWGTFGDSLPAEGLMEAMNSTAKIGEVQGNLADALEWSGVNLDEFNGSLAGMATEEERAAFITDTLNNLYGEAANKYRDVNGSIIEAREAQSNLTDATANLGAITEPITTKIKEGFTQILLKLIELTEGIDFEALGAKISAGFDKFTNETLPRILNALEWIISNGSAIITTITAIGTAFLAWKVVSIIMAVKKALDGMTLAQAALNLVMKANPIGIVITVIAGLVAALITLWHTNEDFRNAVIKIWEAIKKFFVDSWNYIVKVWNSAPQFFSDLWQGIKQAFSDVGAWFKKIFTDAWNGIKNAWSGVKNWFSDVGQGIKQSFSDIGSWFSNKFNEAWNGIKTAFSNVKSFFSGKVNDIKGAFSDIREKFLSVGDNIVKGIWDGIKDGASWLKNKITGFADDVAGWFKKTFKISSPSQLMADEVGLFVGEGVGQGVLNSLPFVKKDLSKFSNEVTDNLGNIKGNLQIGRNGVNGTNGNNVVINSGMTVNYNGQLSRKQLKQIEQDNDRRIINKLKLGGAY